jgi:hypothetical protein
MEKAIYFSIVGAGEGKGEAEGAKGAEGENGQEEDCVEDCGELIGTAENHDHQQKAAATGGIKEVFPEGTTSVQNAQKRRT